MAVCGAVAAMTWRQKMLAVAVASCFAADFSSANPTGPTVARGRASFVTQGNVLTVTNAPGTVINWQSFSIPSQDITRFMQQSAASAVLNRVMSGNPSTILGTLQSNGRVYLINPSGITIGPSGVIDVQGFVASTLNISDADFIAGRHRFAETPGAGAVVNEGRITTPSGGTVYLLGQNVENHGVIRTPRGEIVLAAGRSIELVDARTPELRVEIKAPENEALNLGQLIAEGGRIGMYAGLVRHGGVANANTAVVGENGRIVFKAVTDVTLESGSVTSASGPTAGSVKVAAETGKAIVAGAVEARSSTGRGGVVEVSASRAVSVEPSGRISASGAEGGRITLASSGDAVRVAGPVSVDGSAGGGGRIEIRAATRAVVAEGGRVSSAGALLGGTIDLRAAADVVVEAGGTVHADGRSGGAVTVKSAAGPAILDGTITVEGSSGAGGVIEIDAQTDVIVGSAGTLAARGAAGGSTRVEARQGTLLASGAIDAAGTDGPGGRIMLLAPKVGLVGNGRLNASGRTAGGVVLVGGDFQGANAEVPNAERTYVGHDVLIAADAIDSGDGGRVIVWSEQLTGFFGKVTARGGARSGNGGFVEISGKERLVFRGVVDLSAPAGSGGKLLLDPQDLVIEGGTSNAGGTDATDSTLLGTDDSPGQVLFGENSGALTTITEVGLEAIGAGSDVELQAGHSITTSGSFSSGLTFSPNTNVTFRTRNDAGDDAGSLFAAGINLGAVPITLQGTGTLLISTNDSGAGAGSGGSGGTNPSIRLGGISSAGGSVTVGTGGGTGTITLTGNVATTAGSNAGAVTFSGPAVLAANVVVNTNHGSGADGNVTFGGTVNADAAGNNRTLTLNTGAALATLAGAVGGAASLGGLATTGTAAINGGAVTTSGAQNYGGAVTLGAGATVVASTGGNAITFGGTVNGASALTVNTTGATSFGGAVGGGTALTSVTTNAGGTTAIDGGAVTTTGNQTYNDAVTFGAATTIHSGTGTVTAGATMAASGHTLTVNADEIDFSGGAGSVSGTGAIVLQPVTQALGINTGTAAGGGGALDLNGGDIAALADGFASVSIGQSSGTHAIVVGGTTFIDPVVIRAPSGAGSITIAGPLTGVGNASITLNAGSGGIAVNGVATSAPGANLVLGTTGAIIDDGAGVHRLTSTGNLSLTAAFGIGTIATPLRADTASLSAANGAAGGTLAIENAGPVTLSGTFRNQAAGQELRLTTLNGAIDTAGVAVQSAGGRIAFVANETAAGAGGNITIGSGGIASAGGAVVLHASDNVVVGGPVVSGGGDVRMIAGSPGQSGGLFGYDAAHATFVSPNPSAPTELAPDENGMIVIGAPVNAGSGNVVLVASTTDSAGVVVGIVQGPTAGPVVGTEPLVVGPAIAGNGPIIASSITAVTLRGVGGAGSGGAAIDLNNADNPLNSATGINLFACAVSGCPAVTGPFVTAPFINQVAAPPPVLYADGPIFYTDEFGTNIAGIGTVNDFVYFSPGPLTTVDGSTLYGRNITVEALNDINIDLTAPVRNQNISPGGTVRFVASGNITYNATTTGGTFGESGETFDRNLQFVAANNIDLKNSIYLGTGGSLVVSANQDIVFTEPSAPPGVHPRSGVGSVFMQGNHEIRVGGDLTVNGVNLSIAGGELVPASPNQNATGQLLTTSGTLNLNLSGDVTVTGGSTTLASRGTALLQGADIHVGSAGQPVRSLTITGGTGLAGSGQPDARVSATGIGSVFSSGDVVLTAGVMSSALLEGGTVGVGSAGTRVGNVRLAAGTGPAGGTTSGHQSNAEIVASGTLGVYAAGDLVLTGGTTNILAAAPGTVTASAVANLRGDRVTLDVLGDVALTGGSATARAGGNTAVSTVQIFSTAPFNPVIGGDLSIVGGTAVAAPAGGATANAQAPASLSTGGELVLNVGGDLTLAGGSATATTTGGGARAIANATAALEANGAKDIDVARNFVVTGGNAGTAGSNTTATALAGTNAGTTGFAATLDIRTGRNMTVTGGSETERGIASAAILAAGEIKVLVEGPDGLRLTGGGGTNLFHAVSPTTLVEVQGHSYPITITGSFLLDAGRALGDAFFISGAAPLTLTDPQLLRAMDCISIAGASCTLPASGARAADPAKLAPGAICR